MPNVELILYIIDNFKTINRKLKRNLLSRDTGFDAKNLRYDTIYGSLSKRLSRSKYNTTSLGAPPIQALVRYYKNSTNSAALLIATASAIKIGYDDTGVFSNIKTGLLSTNYVFQTYKDLLYMFNGEDNNIVFNLSTKLTQVENMGVPSMVNLPSATLSLTVGVLSGTVFYAISQQLDGYQEGNVTASVAGIAVTGSQVTLTVPTSTNTRCTGRYIYRTKSNASTLYRLGTITNNSTTTFADNTADASLDTAIIAPTDYGVPAAYKFVTLHKERVFMAWRKGNKSEIVFSDIRNGISYPDVFPVNNALYISRDDGDELTQLMNDHFGQLIAFKNSSVRIINTIADTPYAWDISDNLSIQGNIAPYSAATTPIGIIYLTRYGEMKKRLVLWNGSGVNLIPQLEGIEPILTNIPDTALQDVKGHYHNGYYYLSYRDPTAGDLFNNKVLIIDIFNWGISFDNKNIACFSSWYGASDFGELYSGTSDDTGFVYREDTDLIDLLIRFKSDVDAGTFSQTQSLNIEASPSIALTNDISDDIGQRTWASMTGTGTTWASMTGYNSNWFLTGEWLDKIREINAKQLSTLYWNENNPADSDVLFWLKTGDTESATSTAAWNGPYTNPAGSDLTAVSAKRFLQLKADLFVKNYADRNNVFIYRDGTTDTSYTIKVSANYGVLAETTIEFDWQSGRIDLGDINEVYKRLRKRLRSVKIEFARTSTDGSFDFKWYLDGTTSATGTFNHSFSSSLTKKIYNFPLTNFCEDFMYEIYSNTDRESLEIKRIIFTVNVEPYYSKA